MLLQQYTPQEQLFADPVSEHHTALLLQAGAEGVFIDICPCGDVAEPSQRLHMAPPAPGICCIAARASVTSGIGRLRRRTAAVCQTLHRLQDENIRMPVCDRLEPYCNMTLG